MEEARGVAVPILQLEQAVPSVLSSADPHGIGAYLVVASLLFCLAVMVLHHQHGARRDREHRAALADAYALVREQNAAHLEEQRELARCTQAGLNGALISIQQTNAGLVNAGMQMVAELKPVLQRTVELHSRVERMLEHRVHINGVG